MYLPGSTIKEIATNPEEGGKFVFEVIPGRQQKVGHRCIYIPQKADYIFSESVN